MQHTGMKHVNKTWPSVDESRRYRAREIVS